MWIHNLLVAALLVTASARATATELGCPGRIAVPETTATWYTAVSTNACGIPVAPGAFVIAVAEADFDGGAVCGRCARVTGPLGAVTAKITDYCPALGNVLCVPGHLDLGYDTFEAIGNPGAGVIDIGWETVACEGESSIAIVFRTPSNPYYAKIQVRDARYGVASLEVREGVAWRSAPLAFDGHFEFLSPSPLPASLDLRLTDVHGAVVEALGVPYTEDVALATALQFPACPEPGAALSALAATLAVWSLQRAARTVARSSAP